MRLSRLVLLPLMLAPACAPAAPEPAPPLPLPPASTSAAAPPPASSAAAPVAPPPTPTPAQLRAAFNRKATRLNEPLYWVVDRNKNGEADPDEVASLLFFGEKKVWAEKGAFTEAFRGVKRRMDELVDAQDARIKLVEGELDNAAPALVLNDLRKASEADRAFVGKMLEVSALIDDLYATQTGAKAAADKVAKDAQSQSLFRRNRSTRCVTPGFDGNSACNAAPGYEQRVDVYPQDMLAAANFCETIEKEKDAKKLLSPFTVVRRKGGKDGGLEAVSYSAAYSKQMTQISQALLDAEKLLPKGQEAALRAYLKAASRSFVSNDWLPADEAWSKMNAKNSAWYLRVGPDETYWEPCAHKAGFHMTFARINPASLQWQQRLDPLRQEMEDNLAGHIGGGAYKPRKVAFHLPDFIDIVLNAGDDRAAVGATIGQSLPNWGKVAESGRGRTVAMTNLYTDPDSMAVRRAKAESLLVKETASVYVDEQEPGLISTILHEAAHNLGPTHAHKVDGKKDSDAFGGDLASMLEELKAQTAALWYVSFLQKKGILDEAAAKKVYVDSLVWAFNHISRGMWTGNHQRKHYSQLAAIQVGFLLDEKALVFDPEAPAASGPDRGAYRVDFARLPAAVEAMMREVGRIKATNDKAAAERLSDRYVDGLPDHHKVIAERCLRFPQPNFVYALEL